MKKLRFTALILLFSLIGAMLSGSAAALDEPYTDAAAVMLIETTTGQELYSKSADSRVYPASTTKIMTVLLACEAIDRSDVSASDTVTASENMSFDLISDGSSANIKVGETMTLENLLYCAMLVSGSDACNVIAEYIAGSVYQFVDRMNQRATELGCTGTHFANTHGNPDDNHYVTARDMALIAEAAAANARFMDVANTVTYTVPATNMSDARSLSNTNALINSDSMYGDTYYYEPAAGIKTGYTSAAGNCLVSTASNGTMDLLAVVMNSSSVENGDTKEVHSFSDSITLYEWAFANFSYIDILRDTDFVGEAAVSMGAGVDSVSLRPQKSITLLLPNDSSLTDYDREIVIYSERDGEELVAPLDVGVILGEITVRKDGQVIGTSPLISTSAVDLSKKEYMKQQISSVLENPKVKRVFWICVILFCLYVVWVVIYRVRHLVHLDSVRRAKKARARAMAEREADMYYYDDSPDYYSSGPSSTQTPQGEDLPDYYDQYFNKK